MAIWRIFRRSPLSEEKYPNRNPAWKQALLIIDFQGNTRKGSSTSLSGGGTVREEQAVNFQLYTATDYDHRLSTEKLISIIELSEKALNLPDAEIEVEFQGRTIEKYGLAFVNGQFHLTMKQTDCLAKDKCGIPQGTNLRPPDYESENIHYC